MPRVPIVKLHLNSILNKDPYLLREKSTNRTRQAPLPIDSTCAWRSTPAR